MYVREPHAGERGFPGYEDHRDFEHKIKVAQELQQLANVAITIGVDDMSQAQHARLGNLPNMAYVMNRDGRVAYANTWQFNEDIDATLARLVTADDPAHPVTPTIGTRDLGTDINPRSTGE